MEGKILMGEGSISELLDQLGNRNRKSGSYQSGPRPLAEALVMGLREGLEQYNSPCTFKPGDLVTPRANSGLRGHGEPSIVLEVREDAEPQFVGEGSHSSGFGHRLNVRFLVNIDGQLVSFWEEHWRLQLWDESMYNRGGE